MWFVSQLAFTSQVLSHSLRSTAVCLAGLQSTQYREQGPARRPLPAFVLKLWFGPRCLEPHSNPLREVRRCCHPGKSEEKWRWMGSGRQRDCDCVCVCVRVRLRVWLCMCACVVVWQQWVVTHCCNAVSSVTSMKWSLQSIVRQSCHCFLSSPPTTPPCTFKLHTLTRL